MLKEEESPENQDLDAFLISVESKLRGPFSSLDLGRAIASSRSPREYLQSISKVLPRMDKGVQLRVLVGLLGVDPSEDTDNCIHEILTEAQEAPLHEDWVRVAAGIVQGLLFSRDLGERDMGEEAQKLLEKTCQDILSRKPVATDTDSLFAPYYYSLLNPDTLQRILPESLSNPHFSANENAEILKQDETLEQEEQAMACSASSIRAAEEDAPAALPPVIMPGRGMMRTTASKSKPAATKTSMFLPSKATVGRLGGQLTNLKKPGLHTRKAGAAQSLLGKSRRPAQTTTMATGSSGGGATGTAPGSGRATKFGNNRSKMKMIDVSEVQGLTKERQEREQTETREQTMNARKRKILEAAAAKGLVSGNKGIKKSRPNEQEQSSAVAPVKEQALDLPNAQLHSAAVAAAAPPDARLGSLEATAAAALLAYQQHQQPIAAPAPEAIPQNMPPVPTERMALAPGDKDELKRLLEKSNRLSEENRFRVRQFWFDRFNPTPDVPVYRIKLHEERNFDPETGMAVKETDYLELDYISFGYKKLRKTKKK